MIKAVLRLRSQKKPVGRPLCATRSRRLWVLLDEVEPDLSGLEWVALTEQIHNEGSYEKWTVAPKVVIGRLCAFDLDHPISKHELPPLIGLPSPLPTVNALELLSGTDEGSAVLLAHVLRHLDPAIGNEPQPEQLAALLQSYSLSKHIERLADPTKIVFERGDTLIRELETHIAKVPLTFLIGGASAGRTALSVALGNQSGRFRYLARNNVSETAAATAEEVESAYARTGTLHRSELASLLTALLLAVIEQTGTEVGNRAFPGAGATGAGDPARALAQHFVAQLRTGANDPAEMLAVFFRLLETLVEASRVEAVTTVLLPFEQLEHAWTTHSYPKLWEGLKTLARDLGKQDADRTGKVRLLVMARSLPFQEIGMAGLSTWVLAMPPLDVAEMKTRLEELTSSAVPDDVARAAHTLTGGVPVLTAAIFHSIHRTAAPTLSAIDEAKGQVLRELKKISQNQTVDTASGRLLRSFLQKVKLHPGDDEFYASFAGGPVYFQDDLSQGAFRRLFAAGLLWFEPRDRCGWSSLRSGDEFRMAPSSELVFELLSAQPISRRALVTT